MSKIISLTQCVFLLIFAQLGAEDLTHKINSIKEQLNELPKTSLHESGAPMGFKSKWISSKSSARFVTIDLGKVYPVDQVVIVPAMEPSPEGNKAYCFPKRLKVSISNFAIAGFKEVKEVIKDKSTISSPLPILINLENRKFRYLKIDLLELMYEHYYALGEVFVFSKGRNVALNKKITTNCREKKDPPENMVDGMTSLGMPIKNIKKGTDSQYLWVGSTLINDNTVHFDFKYINERAIDEIRLYNTWLPNRSRPEALPGNLRFYFFEERTDSWVQFYKKSRSNVITVGDNPLAIQFPQVRSKKFRIEFSAVKGQRNDCGMSEIELISWNKSISPEANITCSAKIKNKNRVMAMGDNKLRFGELTLQQDWLKGIVLRHELENNLAVLSSLKDEEEAFSLSLYKNIAFGISALLVISLVSIIKNRYDNHMHQEKLRREIASDLHDEIGSNLACINLIGEHLNQDGIDPEDLKENAREIMDITNETSAFMHDIVWMLDPNRKGNEEFKLHLEEITERLLRNIDFNLQFKHFERIENRSIDLIRNFILFYKEALNNLQKYSKASIVKITMGFHSKTFYLQIEDDGSVPLIKAAPSLHSRADKLWWNFQINHSENNSNQLTLKIRSHKNNG